MKKTLMTLITGLAVVTLFATGSIAAEVSEVEIHGFLSQGYLSTTENDFTTDQKDENFAFNEVGINFSKELTEDLRVGIQLFGRDFGDVGNSDIKIDWAFADYHFHDWLGLRFGQIKTPHGLYNEIRDIDMLRNPVFLPDSIYQEVSQDLYVHDLFLALQGFSSRDLYLSLQGLGLYGFLDLNLLGGFSYQVMYGTQNVEPDSQINEDVVPLFFGNFPEEAQPSASSLQNEEFDVDYKYAGNIIWDTPFEGLRVAASLDNIKMSASTLITSDVNMGASGAILQAGDNIEVDYNKMENWVYSAEYTWDNFLIMAEYLKATKEYENTYNMALSAQLEINTFEIKSEVSGWYVGAAYRFTDWFELGGYYSKTTTDNVEKEAFIPEPDFFSEFNDIAVTTRFDINEFWAIKFEAHRIKGTYAVATSANFFDPAYKDTEDNWNLYAAKMTVAF